MVEFNPWHYSQEKISLKRAFLRDLRAGLGFWHTKFISLDDLYSDSTSIKFHWSGFLRGTLLLIIMTIVATLFYTYIELTSSGEQIRILLLRTWRNLIDFIDFLKFGEKDVPAVISLLVVPIVSYVVGGVFTMNYSTAAISTSEQFREKFKRILGRNNKVVIVVDDLDRCTPETVKEVLDALATFFVDERCSFVITGDHTVVEKYVGSKLFVEPEMNDKGELDNKLTSIKERAEGRRFLKKLFDVYWQIPRPEPVLFQKFIDSEIKKLKILNLNEIEHRQLVNLLDEFLGRNLRAVIRFLSTLRFNLDTLADVIKEKKQLLSKTKSLQKKLLESELKGLEEVISNPVLLAKILLIQELFYPMYEALVSSPETLVLQEKEAKDGEIKHNQIAMSKELVLHQSEDVSLYSMLLRKEPRFTDDDGTVLFSAENFLYLSGFTGLPSQKGPNDESFLNHLKGQTNLEKLVKSMQIASADKRTSLKNIAQSALTNTTITGDQKYAVIANIIQITKQFDEWESLFETLREQVGKGEFISNTEQQKLELIIKPFFTLCFQKGLGVNNIFNETPFDDNKYVSMKWAALMEVNDGSIGVQVFEGFLALVKTEISVSEAEAIKNIEILLAKINPSFNEIKEKLNEFYEFVADLILNKPINDRMALLNFLATYDKEKISSSKYNQKLTELFKKQDPLSEMEFFIDNLPVLSTYLHARYFDNLLNIISKFITSRTSTDWGVLIDGILKQNNLSYTRRNKLLESVLNLIESSDESVLSYSMGYIGKPEFLEYFGKDNVLRFIVNKILLIDITKQVKLLDFLIEIGIPMPLPTDLKSVLNRLSKSKNKQLSRKVKMLLENLES